MSVLATGGSCPDCGGTIACECDLPEARVTEVDRSVQGTEVQEQQSSMVSPPPAAPGIESEPEAWYERELDVDPDNAFFPNKRELPPPLLVWIDVETTGLHPDRGDILEIACLATDEKLAPVSPLLHLLGRSPDPESLEDLILEMHGTNGLLKETREGRPLVQGIQGPEIVAWFDHAARIGGPVLLAGSTVGFDRSWLLYKFPRLVDYLHHRVVDVSTIKELTKRWTPDLVQERETPSIHRAIPDLYSSIEELRGYKTLWDSWKQQDWARSQEQRTWDHMDLHEKRRQDEQLRGRGFDVDQT